MTVSSRAFMTVLSRAIYDCIK